MVDYKDLGRRVRALRRAAHLTQEELAEQVGISASFMGHVERGSRVASLDTLVALWMLSLDTSMLIDVAIHGWVLYYLITGTVAVVKMKNNPELAVEPTIEQPAEFVAPVYEVPAEPAQPMAPAEPAPQVMVNGEPVQE